MYSKYKFAQIPHFLNCNCHFNHKTEFNTQFAGTSFNLNLLFTF